MNIDPNAPQVPANNENVKANEDAATAEQATEQQESAEEGGVEG
jgi:hypothetical protein